MKFTIHISSLIPPAVSLSIAGLFLASAAWARPMEGEGGEFIPLRDGEILVGEITEHTEDGLEVKRLDNGGIVKLRWGQLAPPIENSLREKFGYRHDAIEEVSVEVDEITLLDGSKRVGRILSSDSKGLTLKEKASTLTYERSMLLGAPQKTRVPALDVFTKDELYAEALSAYDLGTARGHIDLMRYLESIRDFDRALRHIEEAKKLDSSGQFTKELTSSGARLAEKKVRQDEIDHLAEIEIQRNRKQWDKAIALCDEFATKFPKAEAKTKADVEKRKTNITDSKRVDYTRRVSEAVHDWCDRLIRNKSLDRKTPYGAAVAYLSSQLKKELFATVATKLQPQSKEFTEPLVAQLWSERTKDKRTQPRPREVSYGTGSFILGKAKAKEGLDNLLDPTAGAGPKKSKEEAEAEAKLKKFLERQGGGGGAAGGGQQKQATPEGWYERASEFERRQFLKAKFVEESGEFDVVARLGVPCSNCGGKGAIETISTGAQQPSVNVGGGGRGGGGQQAPTSGTVTVECPLCHGVQVERKLRFR